MAVTARLGALVVALAAGACGRSAPPAGAPVDCASLSGGNAVQTEMRRLECALQRSVAAIGRDDLASIEPALHVVHEARSATEAALESGAYKPAGGDLRTFAGLDEAFHVELEAFATASSAGDHAASAAALGRVLGACQGCHTTFRPAQR